MNRSNKPDVRNPLVHLPAAVAVQALPADSKAALKALLKEISNDARARATKAWVTHKAPMAVYWKAVAVYTNHLQRIL